MPDKIRAKPEEGAKPGRLTEAVPAAVASKRGVWIAAAAVAGRALVTGPAAVDLVPAAAVAGIVSAIEVQVRVPQEAAELSADLQADPRDPAVHAVLPVWGLAAAAGAGGKTIHDQGIKRHEINEIKSS